MELIARRTAEILCLSSVLLAGIGSVPVAAQTTPPLAPSPLTPPLLLEHGELAYPKRALQERLEATVVLQLTIDVEGRVSEAKVIEPAGHDFDSAALLAATTLRFAPARRSNRPVRARIRYPFVFGLPPESVPPSEPPVAPPTPATAPARASEPDVPAALAAVVAPAAPSAKPMSEATPVDVRVRGRLSEGEKLQQSAEAVNVVETRRAKQQTADMGEVLARTQGIAVRRDGGLGSTARFSLNGLYDDQIRFFLDGVPLDLAGYPFGIENVPVNLVERVEVYRGVVPVRFGADALGGAVNLVSDQSARDRLTASYQVGSFGTHRLTLAGRYRDPSSGVFVGGAGFSDRAKNDYPVDVEIPDNRGRLSPASVKRFHDGYEAAGGTLEVGILDRAWARRLSLLAFTSGYDKQLQNNLVMTVPYGEAHYDESVWGATGRYEVDLSTNLGLELVANYAHRTIDFVDRSDWVYDWIGRRIRERRVPGEISADATDQTAWQNGAFGRATATWKCADGQSLRLSLSPAYTTRTGKDHLLPDPSARDPLTAKRDLTTFVAGLEYELNLLGDRLSNIAFVKDYVYHAAAEDPLPGGIFKAKTSDSHSQGVGDSVRYRFTPWLYAKASYEYATRLPRPDEVFGNGVLVSANLELRPEVSHNANVGPRIELRRTALGALTLDVNAFWRDSDRLIVLLGNDRFFAYQNVYHSRGLGLENALSWAPPGRWLGLDGTLTWQDVRNASSTGTFKDFEGDRIPNRPYLFAAWAARLRFARLPGPDDTVEPFYNGRYVHEFYRGWESQGLRAFKQVVDSQVTHDVGVSWTCLAYVTVQPAFIATVFRGDVAAAVAVRGFHEAPPATGKRAPQLAELDHLLSSARHLVPGIELEYVAVENPGDEASVVTIYGSRPARPFNDVELVFRASDEQLVHSSTASNGNALQRFEAWFFGMHYAKFGGYGLKGLYALLALGTCAVIASGNWVWLERRDRTRRRVGNRLLQRLTIGFCAGVPLAVAALFVGNRSLPAALAQRSSFEQAVFWVTLAAALVWPFCVDSGRRVAGQQLTLAGALFAVALLIDLLTREPLLTDSLQRGMCSALSLLALLCVGCGARLLRVQRRNELSAATSADSGTVSA